MEEKNRVPIPSLMHSSVLMGRRMQVCKVLQERSRQLGCPLGTAEASSDPGLCLLHSPMNSA